MVTVAKRVKPWMILTPLFFLSVIWGVWGILETGRKGFLDACYLTLQLITLGGEFEDGAKPWKLEIARFALPAIASYAVLRGFFMVAGQNWSSLKLRFRVRDHYIICGLGDRGLALAKDLLKQGHPVAAIDINPENQNIASLREHNGIFLLGDATERSVLEQAQLAKASHLVLVATTDVTNFSVLQTAIGLVGNNLRALKCHVLLGNIENRALFEEKGRFFPPIRENGIEISLFNVYENVAIDLFQKHPLGAGIDTLSEQAAPVKILLTGFGRLGEAVLVEIMQMAHFGNQKPVQVTVLDEAANDAERNFMHRYREVRNHINGKGLHLWDLRFIDDIDEAGTLHAYADVVACHDRPEQALVSINELWDRWQGEEGASSTRFFLNSPGDARIANDQIIEFGALAEACSEKIVIAREQEQLAKQSHNEYNRAKLGDQGNRPDLAAKVREGNMTLHEALKQHDRDAPQAQRLVWENLSLLKQGANFTEKRHYKLKLMALGLSLEQLRATSPGPEHADLADLPRLDEIAQSGAKLEHATALMAEALASGLGKEELVTRIDALARSEHKRWNAYHVLNNYRYGVKKDERLRTHDCLLSDAELAIRRPDTIKYDYQNIYQIWDVLQAAKGK